MRLITFDFWNTLFLDTQEGIRHQKRIAFAHQKLCRYRELPLLDVERAFGVAHQAFSVQWESRRAFSMNEHVRVIVRHCEIELQPEEFSAVVDYFETILLEFPPDMVPHAADAIRYCSSKMKVGLVCDTGYTPGRVLRSILNLHGLDKYFDAYSFSNETGVLKPNVEAFRRILSGMNIPPEEAVHIGDLEETDITGAKQVGMKAIKYIGSNPSAKHESIADAVIDDLSELPAVIESM